MMALRPIIIDNMNMILGGNMRYRALRDLGFKEIPDNWVKRADELTPEEKRRFIVADNVGFGEWDWDELSNNWDVDDLEAWGLDVPSFAETTADEKDLSSSIEDLFRIEIICKDEEDQEHKYNKLIEQGYTCRLLTL